MPRNESASLRPVLNTQPTGRRPVQEKNVPDLQTARGVQKSQLSASFSSLKATSQWFRASSKLVAPAHGPVTSNAPAFDGLPHKLTEPWQDDRACQQWSGLELRSPACASLLASAQRLHKLLANDFGTRPLCGIGHAATAGSLGGALTFLSLRLELRLSGAKSPW